MSTNISDCALQLGRKLGMHVWLAGVILLSWNTTKPTPTWTPTSSLGSSQCQHVRRLPCSASHVLSRLVVCCSERSVLPICSFVFHEPDTHEDPCRLVRRAFASRGSSRGCRLGMCMCTLYACTVHDKLSCTHLQNYTIGTSLISVSVSVSVPWNSSFNICHDSVFW